MPVKSLKIIIPTYWVPPIYTANWKVTVERSNGTVDDITEIITRLKIEDGVTETIGNFEFEIPNPNETYTNLWTGMETFRYYSDYASSATTLRFIGWIEKPSGKNNSVVVTGRGSALFVQSQTVTKSYDAQKAGYIIKDLFDTYGQSKYNTASIDTSAGDALTLSFVNLAFWDAIEAVCSASTYDCYISPGLIVQFFAEGSVNNTSEGIVHDYNLIEVGDFAPDLQFVKNQVRVIGGTVDGVQVRYTANDLASQQAIRGIRRLDVNDDGITTFTQAKEYADFILSANKDPPIVGEIKGLLLATIQPGENIRCSSPLEGIAPGNYRCVHYKHEIESGMGYTTITINKEAKKISHIMKDIIQRQNKKTDSASNVDDLGFSEIELFNSDTGTKVSTVISNGVLQLSPGTSQGTWTSSVFDTADGNNVSEIKIGLVADNIPGVSIEVSADNAITYVTVSRDELKTLTTTGNKIVIRLTLNGSSTQVDSLSIQYSTS